jgi:hypothetical protein
MAQNLSRKKNKKHYSKGELNRLVDSVLHPLFHHGAAFMVIDTMFHGLIENNPNVTVRKFARYTLPKIIEEILKGQ